MRKFCGWCSLRNVLPSEQGEFQHPRHFDAIIGGASATLDEVTVHNDKVCHQMLHGVGEEFEE
jgi:hypothetical protein